MDLPRWALYVMLAIVIVAGLAFIPLIGWARREPIGMLALAADSAILIAVAGVYRWAYGSWPGDEHLADLSQEERRAKTVYGIKVLGGMAAAVAVTVAVLLASGMRPNWYGTFLW